MIYKVYKPFNFLSFARASMIFAWFLFVAFLLTMRLPDMEPGKGEFTYLDKCIHFILFGWLARLIAGWFKRYSKVNNEKSATIGLVIASSYALFFEWLQFYMPTRSRDTADLLAGVLGVIIFVFIWLQAQKYLKVEKKPKLLMHACCGPCGSFLSGGLIQEFQPTLFFTNSNIDTKEEHALRWQQVKKVAQFWNLPAIIIEYNHKQWLKKVKGFTKEPEKGKRCPICFEFRLVETAKFARENGYEYFGTTLSVSPHKNYEQILALGKALAKKYKIKFYETDFKKRDGYKQSIVQAKKLGLYRQDYCGCEFSKKSSK